MAMERMPFGRHKGKAFSELPDSYCTWLLDQDLRAQLRGIIENEMQRRRDNNVTVEDEPRESRSNSRDDDEPRQERPAATKRQAMAAHFDAIATHCIELARILRKS
jgi:hypothetical protein